MSYRALIIDDDPGIVDEVVDMVESLGHVADSANCMQSARQRLRGGSYDYILLDLEIPVLTGRSLQRIENGVNLLHEITNTPATSATPVVIMTAHGNEGPEQAVELMCLGAKDYIAKPFNRGTRRFGDIIRRILPEPTATTSKFEPLQHAALPAFEAGELVFHLDRVELCDVKVCGSKGRTRPILDALRARTADGRYRCFGASKLANEIKAKRGQQAVVEAISRFRKLVQAKMAKDSGTDCGPHDVIEHDEKRGYRFSDKITDRDGREEVTAAPEGEIPVTAAVGSGDHATDGLASDLGQFPSDLGHVPGHDLGQIQSDLANDPGTEPRDQEKFTTDQRRRWVLSELGKDRNLRRPDIEAQFGVSQKTATRDLRALKRDKKIEFVGHGGKGYYQLVRKRR